MQKPSKSLAVSVALASIFGLVCVFFIIPNLVEQLFKLRMTDNPVEAHEIGQTIVNYRLPDGYVEEGASVFFGTTMVFIIPEDGTGLAIILTQIETEASGQSAADEAEMKAQIELMFAQKRGSDDVQMTIIEEIPTVINDRTVSLKLMEGRDEQENKYRQIMGVFDAKNKRDTVVLMVRALEAEWDEAAYQQFIESMR